MIDKNLNCFRLEKGGVFLDLILVKTEYPETEF